MDNNERARLRELAEKATQGKRELRGGDEELGEAPVVVLAPRSLTDRYAPVIIAQPLQDGEQGEADAAFTAECDPGTVLELLAAADQAESYREALKRARPALMYSVAALSNHDHSDLARSLEKVLESLEAVLSVSPAETSLYPMRIDPEKPETWPQDGQLCQFEDEDGVVRLAQFSRGGNANASGFYVLTTLDEHHREYPGSSFAVLYSAVLWAPLPEWRTK